MKKLSRLTVLLSVILLAVSCATTIGPTSIIGKWTYTEGTSIYNYLFTTSGTYAYEVIDSENPVNSDYGTFGTYIFDSSKIYFDSDTVGIGFAVDGKTLYIDGQPYTRTAYKVFDDTNNIYGVWSINGQSATLAFTSDGQIIAYETELSDNSYGRFAKSLNKVIAEGKTTQYLIIDDTIYIKPWEFLGSEKAIKLYRLSNGGKNKSSFYLTLVPEIPYSYYDFASGDFVDCFYTFLPDGTYFSEDQTGTTTKGTYTYDGTKIQTSEGQQLTFMVIDDLPFGYII